MSVLAAFDLSRPFTRFDVWTVVFWVNILIIAGLAVVLFVSLRRDKSERVPANLDPFFDDDKLEGPHLERVLGWALFFFAIFAVTLPLYWLREGARGKASVAYFEENSVRRGEELFSNASMPKFNAAASLQCANCHGPDGGGGAAPYTYTDPKTGVAHLVSWKAPALNTVLYRFSPDEVNDIITRGRPGTPMQGWGVDRKGGGPKNAQSIDDLVSYLVSIQLPPGTPEEAAKDVEGCLAESPKSPTTALGQAACAQENWKRQPDLQYEAAQKSLTEAKKIQADDKAQFEKLGCRASFAEDDNAAQAISDPEEQKQALADRDTCRTLRPKVTPTVDPVTPLDQIALDAAQKHLDALKKANGTPEELKAAQTELDTAQKTIDANRKAYDDKNCTEDGTAPDPVDEAACRRLARALYKQTYPPTNDVAVANAQTAVDWATEWRDRRKNVTDGQVLFETNCARCHTKNWSIFDPANTGLKPEDLLEAPGGGGSIGFNLRAGQMQRRFPDVRNPSGELVPDSGALSHVKFITEGSYDGKAYGVGGRGSGMMPGQCNDAVQADATAKKLNYYGCMLSTASTPKLAPTKYDTTDPAGGIDDAMIDQIVAYERCGLDATKNDLAAAQYPTKCQ